MLALIGVGSLAASFDVFSQQPGKVWRIGFLSTRSGPDTFLEAFHEQLRVLGYVEGRNLVFVYRWAPGKEHRLPELAAELAQLKVDVILAASTEPAVAAKRATSTIPIVMATASDPVSTGLVASLARPGGNVTGNTMLSTELAGKRLQLVRELIPKVTRIGLLAFAGESYATAPFIEEIRAAAQQMGITLVVQRAKEAGELVGAFSAMRQERAQAVFVQVTPFTVEHRTRIVELAVQHRLPALFNVRNFVEVGGLISYGPSLNELWRNAARYVDRIFKGARPADLPVEQPTKFEMVINLKTAKVLGIKLPQSVLARADEVIQ